MEKENKVKKIKFSNIIFIFIILFIVLFIVLFLINRIMIYNVLKKSYDTYDVFRKKDNIYAKAIVSSHGETETTSISEIYKNGDKMRSVILFSNLGEVINTFKRSDYYDKNSEEYIEIFNINGQDTYSIGENNFFLNEEGIYYSSIILGHGNFDGLKLFDRIQSIYMLFLYLEDMYIEKVDDKECYVISINIHQDEIDVVEKVWIDKETFLPVKDETYTVWQTLNKNGVLETEYSKEYRKFEYKENVVTEEDVKWPDLSGKKIELIY